MKTPNRVSEKSRKIAKSSVSSGSLATKTARKWAPTCGMRPTNPEECIFLWNSWKAVEKINSQENIDKFQLETYLIPIRTIKGLAAPSIQESDVVYGESTTKIGEIPANSLKLGNTSLKPGTKRYIFNIFCYYPTPNPDMIPEVTAKFLRHPVKHSRASKTQLKKKCPCKPDDPDYDCLFALERN